MRAGRYAPPIASRCIRTIVSNTKPKVAVFYQALNPPAFGGVTKPKKPGGYQDSGADIAYALRCSEGVDVLTPIEAPTPEKQEGWTFPDTESGILSAVRSGATHLWMNTILFKHHPLQTSTELTPLLDDLFIIGQPPNLVEDYDDKAVVNDFLRSTRQFLLPASKIIHQTPDITDVLKQAVEDISLPIIAKPIRGRGSHGVKLCHTADELKIHVEALLQESPSIMLEQYLSGQEATVTTLPPFGTETKYKSLPPVVRFNHSDGVAPYNGAVAVTQNSRVASSEDINEDPAYERIMAECEQVASLLGTTAPIRIDVRRESGASGRFAVFDVNMKPNMTGPGRPGREDQASLTALAAEPVGWDYTVLLTNILDTARPLRQIRAAKSDIIKVG
ncbi:glutathione synthetase ATP-binding domain-like protein [Corynespora cassiicola Philippines]|uniref:Glutathione synthetase ATP-binding domain-like protein n=1 Tax=Corynespora cassiicola Philippines TaxID=1448308 RepID=A0A2T2NJ99_CORCC|nr:glutathione synthetase ATP-binding domain-like protein [Corynespora cassiicola Philippines]